MLSFLHSSFLLALAGLALPVLIHRISRAQARAWPFPSIRLIHKVPLPRQGRRKISDWWLLLLRMLLFALLILGLAGPQWTPPAESTFAPDRPGHTVIVADFSASLLGWNGLRQMRDELDSLFAELPDDEWIGAVAFDKEILSAIAPAVDSRDLSQSVLRQTDPRTVKGRPLPAIERALNFLTRAPAIAPRRLVLLADFQSATWANPRLPQIPPSIQLDLRQLGSPRSAPNLAIMDTRTVPLTEQGQMQVIAKLRNFGQQNYPAEIILRTADRSARQSIDMEPASGQTVSFTVPVPDGDPEGTLQLMAESDAYAPDNTYRFWAAEPPAVTVLSMVENDAPADDHEEAFFLDQALQAISEHEWLGFSTAPVSVDRLANATLQRAAAVFLPANQSAATATPWPQLADWTAAGGTVLATLDTGAARALREMSKAGLHVPAYQGRTGMERDRRAAPAVGDLPPDSPLRRVFSGDAARDLYLLNLRHLVRLSKPESARLWLQSEEGEPLLLEIPHGKGRLLLSAFPWNRNATDLPLRAAFLPMVRELLAASVPPDGGIRKIATYDPLPGALPGSNSAEDTAQPDVRYLAGSPVQINVPRSESDPARIPMAELRTVLRGGSIEDSGSATDDPSPSLLAGPATVPLGRWFLLVAILIAVLETALAYRLSRVT